LQGVGLDAAVAIGRWLGGRNASMENEGFFIGCIVSEKQPFDSPLGRRPVTQHLSEIFLVIFGFGLRSGHTILAKKFIATQRLRILA
jgi:hypothetical protein